MRSECRPRAWPVLPTSPAESAQPILRGSRAGRFQQHFLQPLLGLSCPALPAGQLGPDLAGVDVGRGDYVAASLGNERPVRTDVIVSTVELGQAGAAVAGVVVHAPVDLFLLEHLVEALKQAELLRGAVAEADMAVAGVGEVSRKRWAKKHEPLSVTRSGGLASGPLTRSASARARSSPAATSAAE